MPVAKNAPKSCTAEALLNPPVVPPVPAQVINGADALFGSDEWRQYVRSSIRSQVQVEKAHLASNAHLAPATTPDPAAAEALLRDLTCLSLLFSGTDPAEVDPILHAACDGTKLDEHERLYRQIWDPVFDLA